MGHIAKMVEALISCQIIDILDEHGFISVDESAYLKRHSTQTSLHRILHGYFTEILLPKFQWSDPE